jgi:hypothetical protein
MAIVRKNNLTIAEELLDAADNTSQSEASLMVQAAQVHVLLEGVRELKLIREELTSLRKTQEK